MGVRKRGLTEQQQNERANQTGSPHVFSPEDFA
jgi:hypothetical protein